MPSEIAPQVEWDGRALFITIPTEAGAVLCQVSREAIHAISIDNDAIDWEIERHKADIVARLEPALWRLIKAQPPLPPGQPLCVSRSDIVQFAKA